MGLLDEIKSDAAGNNTKIQSSEASKLERILNNTFYCDKDIDGEVEFIRHVMVRGQLDQERRGLHASNMLVGDKDYCVRAQVLSMLYAQSQRERVPPDLLRIFEEGNAIHEKWQRLFIRAGYGTYRDMDRTRFHDEYMLQYSPDAIVTIPEFHDGPMVCEIKSVNTFQFKKQSKHPTAWKQCQWYMHLTGIDKGFVLSEDKNTQQFQIEVYDYDPELVAPFVDRCEEILYHFDRAVEQHKMVKRHPSASGPECKLCVKCVMHDACWNVGMGRVKLGPVERR